jgi:hypothetical protein
MDGLPTRPRTGYKPVLQDAGKMALPSSAETPTDGQTQRDIPHARFGPFWTDLEIRPTKKLSLRRAIHVLWPVHPNGLKPNKSKV